MDEWEFRRIAQAIYLMPRTAWTGRRLADSGVLTLEDAARFASAHARQEITPEDFLRAAARGEVQLSTMARHDVWMTRIPPEGVVVHESQRRKRVRAGAWVAVPAYACRQLLAWGGASWRTEEELEQDRHGLWWHVDSWMLEPDEPPFDAVPADCRVSGYAMHALADAFLLYAQEREAPAADAAGAAGEPEEAAIDAGAALEPRPPPLDTRTMASALDGIEDRDTKGWRRLLGDPPKWVLDARVTPGASGRESATWDPVQLALLMLSKPGITQGRLSKMFREHPELEGWRGAWEAAQGAFSDYGI